MVTLPVGAHSFYVPQSDTALKPVRGENASSKHSLQSECKASQPLSLWKYYTIITDILQGHARKDCCIIAYVRERKRGRLDRNSI